MHSECWNGNFLEFCHLENHEEDENAIIKIHLEETE
jgi:hypothetical protein